MDLSKETAKDYHGLSLRWISKEKNHSIHSWSDDKRIGGNNFHRVVKGNSLDRGRVWSRVKLSHEFQHNRRVFLLARFRDTWCNQFYSQENRGENEPLIIYWASSDPKESLRQYNYGNSTMHGILHSLLLIGTYSHRSILARSSQMNRDRCMCRSRMEFSRKRNSVRPWSRHDST